MNRSVITLALILGLAGCNTVTLNEVAKAACAAQAAVNKAGLVATSDAASLFSRVSSEIGILCTW